MIFCLVKILCSVPYLVLIGGFVFPVNMKRFVSVELIDSFNVKLGQKNPKFFLHKRANHPPLPYEIILFREGSKALFLVLL